MVGFCGTNHLWPYNHVDDYHYQFVDEFHYHFVEAAIIELIIMLTPLAWWHYQNKEIFVYLNVDCLCLFDKLSLIEISRFLRIYETISTWMLTAYWRLQKRDVSLLGLNGNCLYLFDKLLLTRNFVEGTTYDPVMRLILIDFILMHINHNDVIRIKWFIFVLKLIASI